MTNQLELIQTEAHTSEAVATKDAQLIAYEWRLAPETIATGLKGVAEAREVLRRLGGVAA